MPVLEGVWKCKQCLTDGIPGLDLNCPTCGDPRNLQIDPEERPYLPANPRVITDEAELQLANAGPNWFCDGCGEANIHTKKKCKKCKRPRDGNDFVSDERTYVDGVERVGKTLSTPEQLADDRVDAVLLSADPLQELETEPVQPTSRTLGIEYLPASSAGEGNWPAYPGGSEPTDSPRSSGPTDDSRMTVFVSDLAVRLSDYRRMLLIGLAGLAAVAFVTATIWWIYVNYFETQPVNLTVQSLSWKREVDVEVFKTLVKEDWDPPSDARILDSWREIRRYEQVVDHYEKKTRTVYDYKKVGTRKESYVCGSTVTDNGNGTFEETPTYCDREVDVYDNVPREEEYEEPVYRSVPVYDTKYRYEIDRWVYDRSIATDGGENTPYYATPQLGPKERIGDKRDWYWVGLSDDQSREFDREVSEYIWSSLHVGQVLIGHQNKQGTVLSVEWSPASTSE